MISARIFVCHDLHLAEDTRPETQVFQQLCQRLRETGAEVVTYEGSASEEAFFTFCYQELPTCQWFLIFQTPDIILVPAIRTAVNIAQTRLQQGQMQGILRFLMLPDETREWAPEWSAIPTVGASYDYPRAIEKLILAISLHGETTEKGSLIAPPPPLPFAVNSPLLLSTFDAQPYHSLTSAATTYDTTYSGVSISQPAFDPTLLDSAYDRPPEPPTRFARLKATHPATPRILLVALVLALLLVILFGAASPLRALIAGPQATRGGSLTQKQATTTASATNGPTATSTSNSTIGIVHVGITPTATGKAGTTPTPTSGTTPTPAPTAKPTPKPTPTPKPVCPAEIQSGSTGALVETLQRELNARGIKGADGKTLTVDGDFGPNTEYAVKSWQTREQIEVDGQVGPVTWHTLGNC